MTRSLFNTDWTLVPKINVFAQLSASPEEIPVTLPHDALISRPRSESGHSRTGFFPEGLAVTYAKTFDVPEDWRDRYVSIEFQGAYRDAMVFVNNEYVGQRPYGYSAFVLSLDDFLAYGRPNTIRVDVRAYEDSRWYSGVGLIRDVVLNVAGQLHLADSGPVATTADVDAERAVVAVEIPLVNSGRSTATVMVETSITDRDGQPVAGDCAPLTLRGGDSGSARHRLYLRTPQLWSLDDPYLYQLTVTLRQDDQVTDQATVPLGIRTLQLDPSHGLRINGKEIKLRGACLHHDNGLIGAVSIARAEERRVEILKQAGFNAIRSAHNPASPALLAACDRLGMLVMDEAFDIWTEGKNSFDYSINFPEWWERDIESMVLKDRNHPSVIFYSIGNEIVETGSPLGSAWGRQLAEKVRQLDSTRFVTNGINAFVALIRDVAAQIAQMMAAAGQDQPGAAGGVNDFMNAAAAGLNQITQSEAATRRLAESFATLDVVGLNYGDGRYAADGAQFPNRVIVGSETFPTRIGELWQLVEDNPHVIGDFTWTGWDYLGEAGVGQLHYADNPPKQLEGAFPWLTAWCGDIDITGYRRAASYYRQTVFGLRHEPYIAVERPENYQRVALVGQWTWIDALASWTWDCPPGSPIRLEVYSDADEVELLINGQSQGRQPAGKATGYRTRFDTCYEPGEVVAVAYCNGVEQARTKLVTAGDEVCLAVTPDRETITAAESDLAYVTIELRDNAGTLVTNADREIQVAVDGAGCLMGLGSGRPDTQESFTNKSCTTFGGRALAIIRPTGAGEINLTVSTAGLAPVTKVITVASVTPAGQPLR